MQAIKNTIEEKNKISKLKRNSEFSKTNRIRLELFSFEKNEIKEKQKQKPKKTENTVPIALTSSCVIEPVDNFIMYVFPSRINKLKSID